MEESGGKGSGERSRRMGVRLRGIRARQRVVRSRGQGLWMVRRHQSNKSCFPLPVLSPLFLALPWCQASLCFMRTATLDVKGDRTPRLRLDLTALCQMSFSVLLVPSQASFHSRCIMAMRCTGSLQGQGVSPWFHLGEGHRTHGVKRRGQWCNGHPGQGRGDKRGTLDSQILFPPQATVGRMQAKGTCCPSSRPCNVTLPHGQVCYPLTCCLLMGTVRT